MRYMKDRIMKLINEVRGNEIALANYEADILADHLIANGVILLPFKIGQTLYDVTEFVSSTYAPEMYELKDNELSIEKGKDGKLTFVYDGMYVFPEDIGKTVFLTKEEAEKALKEKEK